MLQCRLQSISGQSHDVFAQVFDFGVSDFSKVVDVLDETKHLVFEVHHQLVQALVGPEKAPGKDWRKNFGEIVKLGLEAVGNLLKTERKKEIKD